MSRVVVVSPGMGPDTVAPGVQRAVPARPVMGPDGETSMTGGGDTGGMPAGR
ncbi:hypothetical protein [Actinoplanes regularis]|nr:hypothetical protein [Actinoplanes regularis]